MSASPYWPLPPAPLTLGSEEVHVWRAPLDATASQIEKLLETLAPDEQRRAERYHFRRDREHFIVARGVLREILSRYLGLAPGQLGFCYNAYGKPALDSTIGTDMLRFNLSHSHGLALYAITRAREVGVDLEQVRPDFACEQIARQFFSTREVAALRRLPAGMKVAGFFNCWTRKEAYIKARGEGLALPLDGFAVSLTPGEPAALLTSQEFEPEGRWSLRALDPGPGYVAALAVEGHDWRLNRWQWVREGSL